MSSTTSRVHWIAPASLSRLHGQSGGDYLLFVPHILGHAGSGLCPTGANSAINCRETSGRDRSRKVLLRERMTSKSELAAQVGVLAGLDNQIRQSGGRRVRCNQAKDAVHEEILQSPSWARDDREAQRQGLEDRVRHTLKCRRKNEDVAGKHLV